MDLIKILNHENSMHATPLARLIAQGKTFFANLLNQLEFDLEYLRNQPKFVQQDYFYKIRVLTGNFELSSAYLFLQLPHSPGFLIESEKDSEIYKMYRATKVNPMLNMETGETTRPEIFVLKSTELEEFRVLDECFVRTTTSDKTLSVKQMSEMLLLLTESVR